MKNSKLILMLQTLTEEEIRDLGKFLENQGHRKTGGVYLLYKYLKKYHPVFPEKNTKREVVKQKVFKEAKSSDRRLFDSSHHIVNALEKFLIAETLKESEIEQDFLLLKALKKRKLDKFFFQKIETIEKSWEKENIPGIEHLHDVYKLKEMCFRHPNYSNLNDTPLDPPDLLVLVDQYYFATKLHMEIGIQMTNAVFINEKLHESQELLNEIIDLAESDKYCHLHQLNFSAKLIKALKTNNYDNYDELKDSFVKHLDLYKTPEQIDILNVLTHICYQNYTKALPGSLQKLFDLYRFSVEKKLIISDNYIGARLFEVIVNIGCAANELEWTAQFIEDYKGHLKEEERVDMCSLCEVNLAICQKEYEKALQKIAQIKYQTPYYGLQARSLQLQCYYELEDYEDLFDNLVRSFSTYLKRDQLFPDSVKGIYHNFIKYTKQLKKSQNDKRLWDGQLIDKIENEGVAWKQWLLKKIEEQLIKHNL